MVSEEDRPSASDALIGRTIAGKYTLESRVGGGGMGSVYRARQAGLNKTVAVKLLHRELMAEPTFATRFKREATSASRIDHPSSMRVLDFGEEPDGLLFIAMEFLEGRTLFKVLREEAPLAPARIVELSRQILAALAAAHELGIVHRDLKPENVLVLAGKDDDGGATEHVKVCDFGIAKLQRTSDSDEKLTLEGSIVGTPEYLSPEQARGGELDARSDLYSMGVIVFEMLTGQPPFHGDTPLATVLKHLDATPPRPSSITPAADPKLEAVCLKALSKSPGDRYASAREMRAALVTDSPEAGAPPPGASRGAFLLMTETPPPVSSTQAPVPLLSKRSSSLGSGAHRPRLSELSEAAPSGSSRSMMMVVAVALLVGAGGGAAYWMKHATPNAHARTVAADGPTIAPSSTVPVVADSAAPPPPSLAPAVSGSAGSMMSPGAFPLSELPVAAPSASAASSHHRGKGKSAGGLKDTSAPEVDNGAAASDAIPAYADDLGPAKAVAPASKASVHFSNIQVTGIGATNVTAALPASRFASCYHGVAGSRASVNVHLDLQPRKTVAKAAISDPAFTDLGQCLAGVANAMRVSGVPDDGAQADVQVDLAMP